MSAVRTLCTVRDCASELVRAPRTWRCRAGHAFDVARSGYVNLLQPGDRRSRQAGDSPASVAARFRLDERGVGAELHAALERRVAALALPTGAAALDVGAGTGLLLDRLAAAFALEGWALDLSVPAVDQGSRRRPRLAWVVANADRRLPFADATFALLVSSVGPKNSSEFRRVLAPSGVLLLVVPAADDLIELRAAVQGEGRLVERTARARSLFETHFDCVRQSAVRAKRRLAGAELEDVLATTYRGARRSQRERLAAVGEIETTFAAEILEFVPHRRAP